MNITEIETENCRVIHACMTLSLIVCLVLSVQMLCIFFYSKMPT